MIFLILLCFLVKVSSCFDLSLLQKDLPVAVEVFLKANETSVGSECFQDIQAILQGIAEEQPWARQVLGSSGNRQSRFLWSRKLWLGSRESCLAVNSLATNSTPVTVDYRILSGKSDPNFMMKETGYERILSFQHFHLGLCLPKSCSFKETLLIAQEFLRNDNVSKIFKLTDGFTRIKDLNKTTADLWMDCCFLTAIGLAVTLGILTFLSNHSDLISNKLKANGIKRFLLCFNFRTNYSSTLSTTIPPDTILPIQGLKTFSCLWIMSMHLMVFNLPNHPVKLENIIYQILYVIFLASVVVVDIFFICSGVILTYNFFRNEKLQRTIRDNSFFSNVKLYLQMLLNRYLRLTPISVVSIILSRMVYVYLDSIDAYPLTRCPDIECQKWYRNLFYVQNWFPNSETCQNWSWYIASDMQLFALFTPILFLQTKYPRCARLMLLVLMAFGCVSIFQHDLKFNFLKTEQGASEICVLFLYRMFPYGMGILIGMSLVKVQNFEFPSLDEASLRHYGLILGIVVIGSQFINLGIYKSIFWKLIRNAPVLLYLSLTGFFVYWTTKPNSRWVSLPRLASHPYCQRINKISFSLFMFHYIVISLAFGGQLPTTDITLSLWVMIFVTLIGVFTLTYFVAIFFTATVEIPFQKLAKEFIMRPLSEKEVVKDEK